LSGRFGDERVSVDPLKHFLKAPAPIRTGRLAAFEVAQHVDDLVEGEPSVCKDFANQIRSAASSWVPAVARRFDMLIDSNPELLGTMQVEYPKRFLAIVTDALTSTDDRPAPRPTWPRPCSARRPASNTTCAPVTSSEPG
jgi:hypothetical protein